MLKLALFHLINKKNYALKYKNNLAFLSIFRSVFFKDISCLQLYLISSWHVFCACERLDQTGSHLELSFVHSQSEGLGIEALVVNMLPIHDLVDRLLILCAEPKRPSSWLHVSMVLVSSLCGDDRTLLPNVLIICLPATHSLAINTFSQKRK